MDVFAALLTSLSVRTPHGNGIDRFHNYCYVRPASCFLMECELVGLYVTPALRLRLGGQRNQQYRLCELAQLCKCC
jgi:hypothetical protein